MHAGGTGRLEGGGDDGEWAPAGPTPSTPASVDADGWPEIRTVISVHSSQCARTTECVTKARRISAVRRA